MTSQLVPSQNEFQLLDQMAKAANASKYYDKLGGTPGILSIMLLARELDVPPMQALSGGIWNIQGKVEMSARLMNMKIRQAGHKLKIEMGTEQCTIVGVRKDTGEEMTCTFSMKDADRAGLAGRDTWKKYPREMLFARCLSLLARALFPDVIGNCYVEGEIRDIEKEDRTLDMTLVEKPFVQYITTDQVTEISNLIGDDKDRLRNLLDWAGVGSITEIRAELFDKIVNVLKIPKAI